MRSTTAWLASSGETCLVRTWLVLTKTEWGGTHIIPDKIVELPCFALVLIVYPRPSAIAAKCRPRSIPVTKHTTDLVCWTAVAMPSCNDPGKKVMMAACRRCQVKRGVIIRPSWSCTNLVAATHITSSS